VRTPIIPAQRALSSFQHPVPTHFIGGSRLSGERIPGHRKSWRQSHSPSVPGAGRRGRAGGGAYAANALRIESLLMSVTSSCVELPPAVMWCCERDSPDQSLHFVPINPGRRRRCRGSASPAPVRRRAVIVGRVGDRRLRRARRIRSPRWGVQVCCQAVASAAFATALTPACLPRLVTRATWITSDIGVRDRPYPFELRDDHSPLPSRS
jgi:hypothetical protein